GRGVRDRAGHGHPGRGRRGRHEEDHHRRQELRPRPRPQLLPRVRDQVSRRLLLQRPPSRPLGLPRLERALPPLPLLRAVAEGLLLLRLRPRRGLPPRLSQPYPPAPRGARTRPPPPPFAP